MKRKRYTDPQIVFALQQAEAGKTVGEYLPVAMIPQQAKTSRVWWEQQSEKQVPEHAERTARLDAEVHAAAVDSATAVWGSTGPAG